MDPYDQYYFQVKVGLTDKRFPSKVLVTTPLIDLVPDNEVRIVNVLPTTNRIDICGSFSEELGPGICFIKYGQEEWQTINFCSTLHDNLLISSRRKEYSPDNIDIRIKVLFPKQRDYSEEGGVQNLSYEDLPSAGGLSVSEFVKDITDFYEHVDDDISYNVHNMNKLHINY